MITYLLPTRNRHACLEQTLLRLGELDPAEHEKIGGAEVIVIDNASDPPVRCVQMLDNGVPVHLVRLEANLGAAARNVGAQRAHGDWIVMLDDDSYPLNSDHIAVLLEAPPSIAAIGAEIMLPNGSREAGGLPEVIIGCGAALRRDAFLSVKGYDESFDFYAEEYDLCAKLLLDGWQVEHDFRFRVAHEKETINRDFTRILQRLVRNNCWVVQRYAPADVLQIELADIIGRYAQIGVKENASWGFCAGMAETLQTLCAQFRRPMPREIFDRFTGLNHVREHLSRELHRGDRVAVVDSGKNARIVCDALLELGVILVNSVADAEAVVVGTLSPGPMMDAYERLQASAMPVLLPWRPKHIKCEMPALQW